MAHGLEFSKQRWRHEIFISASIPRGRRFRAHEVIARFARSTVVVVVVHGVIDAWRGKDRESRFGCIPVVRVGEFVENFA